jgi:hypothetical protein
VKAGGKQNNPPAGKSGFYRKQREVEDWNAVPTGSSVGQNETTNTHWLHEKTKRRQELQFRLALKRTNLLV